MIAKEYEITREVEITILRRVHEAVLKGQDEMVGLKIAAEQLNMDIITIHHHYHNFLKKKNNKSIKSKIKTLKKENNKLIKNNLKTKVMKNNNETKVKIRKQLTMAEVYNTKNNLERKENLTSKELKMLELANTTIYWTKFALSRKQKLNKIKKNMNNMLETFKNQTLKIIK